MHNNDFFNFFFWSSSFGSLDYTIYTNWFDFE
jgi:hypothetical protein